MTGTYAPVGLPVNIGNQWYQPPHLIVASAGSASPGVFTLAAGDVLPVSLATSELTALVGRGGATQVG
jgi:hypothetical protein